jgi:hypothetical protein
MAVASTAGRNALALLSCCMMIPVILLYLNDDRGYSL